MLNLTEKSVTWVEKKTMLTVNMYNKVGVVSMSIMELSASDKYIARFKEGT